MAIDPICGMTVDERTAISAERGGPTFYFCSEHCRRKFVEGREPKVHNHDLVNLTVTPHAIPDPPVSIDGTIYTCPMHPEIEQDHPGTCPKCGMALEPKTITAEPE